MTEPIPAATLILLRNRTEGAPECLMMRRHAGLAFAADAWVFPGGRVDADDRLLAARHGAGLEAEDAAARVAAIRETIEEVGLAVALDPVASEAEVVRLRGGLADGRTFSALLDETGLALRLDRLVPFARWAPPPKAPRRFDTRFYLIAAGDDAPIGVDGFEGVDFCWIDPEAMLARAEEGAAKLLFPTRANLARLAIFTSFAEVAAAAGAIPVRLIETIAERHGEQVRLSIPEGHGYPPVVALIEPAGSRF